MLSSRKRQVTAAALGLSNSILFYSVSAAAFDGLTEMGFSLPFLEGAALCSCLCYGIFLSTILRDLKLKARGFAQIVFSAFSLFAAAPLFTGAHEGSRNVVGLSEGASLSVAAYLFLFRAVTFIHSSIGLPHMLQLIQKDWRDAVHRRDGRKLLELGLISLAALAYSYGVIDSTYDAPKIVLNWLGLSSPPIPLLVTIGAFGSMGTFPLALCGFYRGVKIVKEEPLALTIPLLTFTAVSSIGAVGAVIAREVAAVNTGLIGLSPGVVKPIAAGLACLYGTLLGAFGAKGPVETLCHTASHLYSKCSFVFSSCRRHRAAHGASSAHAFEGH